ncbi:MAG: hypothetical protein V4494_07875 [Chlamydiota bacterium]
MKKTNFASSIDLSRSFTKIDSVLHLAFDKPEICPVLSSYVPDTIIYAGNGAVEIVEGRDCWEILKDKMKEAGLLGQGKYQEGEDVLTWLAAQHDFFSKTLKPDSNLKFITDLKVKIIQALEPCETLPREMYCHACTRHHVLPVSKKILILTTNWDLGLFKKFPNVIQLHGRCDYPEQAILPLQNISALMAQTTQDLKRLNCGIFPGPFIERCLKKTKNFIFWGAGLNDYDGALWHFLRGFLAQNPLVKVGIVARNDPESFKSVRKKVLRFFPPLQPKDCFCDMLPLHR